MAVLRVAGAAGAMGILWRDRAAGCSIALVAAVVLAGGTGVG